MYIRVKQIAGFFLIAFFVTAFLGILAAVAIPNVGRMIAKEETETRLAEFNTVQAAVNEMLSQSVCGAIEPIGPTSDMCEVWTRDTCPLILADYLEGVKLDSGCRYCFTADGTVVQMVPQ
jgi:type II secretory pathway pseudopilin PulG